MIEQGKYRIKRLFMIISIAFTDNRVMREEIKQQDRQPMGMALGTDAVFCRVDAVDPGCYNGVQWKSTLTRQAASVRMIQPMGVRPPQFTWSGLSTRRRCHAPTL